MVIYYVIRGAGVFFFANRKIFADHQHFCMIAPFMSLFLIKELPLPVFSDFDTENFCCPPANNTPAPPHIVSEHSLRGRTILSTQQQKPFFHLFGTTLVWIYAFHAVASVPLRRFSNCRRSRCLHLSLV